MAAVKTKRDIQEVRDENDKILMKIQGIEYEKFFPQEHQCEK
jgi:hypothetical protein